MKSKYLLILFIGGFVIASCGDNPHYDKTFAFENKTWDQRVMPSFTVDIPDTSNVYDFVITLRTTTSYSFNNLWVFLNTKTPSGVIGREPFQIRIANDDGSWIGTKSGTVVENQLVFNARKFPEKGTFKFTLEQGISEETIDEVLDIGLRISERK